MGRAMAAPKKGRGKMDPIIAMEWKMMVRLHGVMFAIALTVIMIYKKQRMLI